MTEEYEADQEDPELEGSADELATGSGSDDDQGLAPHLGEQLGGDDMGVDEALQAWREGGHATDALDDSDEIQAVQLPQLDPGTPLTTGERQVKRLRNVVVRVSVELGRRKMTVRAISDLKLQDVIELDKLAGESFEIRVNGRQFAMGEVVVVTDQMAVRITTLVDPIDQDDARSE
jgi:flagellar motor switch protein FliN